MHKYRECAGSDRLRKFNCKIQNAVFLRNQELDAIRPALSTNFFKDYDFLLAKKNATLMHEYFA